MCVGGRVRGGGFLLILLFFCFVLFRFCFVFDSYFVFLSSLYCNLFFY